MRTDRHVAASPHRSKPLHQFQNVLQRLQIVLHHLIGARGIAHTFSKISKTLTKAFKTFSKAFKTFSSVLRTLTNASKTIPSEIDFAPSVLPGAKVWMVAFWRNRRDEAGPASVAVSTRLGDSMAMAA